jgi:hypothetical protein
VLAVLIAMVIPAAVGAGGWAAFLTLRRATPAELTASSALGTIDTIRLVDSVIHLEGRTLRARCLTGRFSTSRFTHPVHAEFAVFSNGAHLFDFGFGPHDLADTLQPSALVRAEWSLAGCSGSCSRSRGARPPTSSGRSPGCRGGWSTRPRWRAAGARSTRFAPTPVPSGRWSGCCVWGRSATTAASWRSGVSGSPTGSSSAPEPGRPPRGRAPHHALTS